GAYHGIRRPTGSRKNFNKISYRSQVERVLPSRIDFRFLPAATCWDQNTLPLHFNSLIRREEQTGSRLLAGNMKMIREDNKENDGS
ncbi:mCG1035743, partial [Mus musculus]